VEALFYIRLIALTAGTLVYLFLIALILGHRRPRTLERLLFFLVLSIFLIYAGGLLQINAQIQYGGIPPSTSLVYLALQALGLVALPGLLLHTFLQFRSKARPRHLHAEEAPSRHPSQIQTRLATALPMIWKRRLPRNALLRSKATPINC